MYKPIDIEATDYDPFKEKTDYVPQEREYRMVFTPELCGKLRVHAESELRTALRSLRDLRTSHDIFMANGCSEEQYREFVRFGEKDVDDWRRIVAGLSQIE